MELVSNTNYFFEFSKIQNEKSSPSCEDVQDIILARLVEVFKSYVLLDLETIYMGQHRGFHYLSAL